MYGKSKKFPMTKQVSRFTDFVATLQPSRGHEHPFRVQGSTPWRVNPGRKSSKHLGLYPLSCWVTGKQTPPVSCSFPGAARARSNAGIPRTASCSPCTSTSCPQPTPLLLLPPLLLMQVGAGGGAAGPGQLQVLPGSFEAGEGGPGRSHRGDSQAAIAGGRGGSGTVADRPQF